MAARAIVFAFQADTSSFAGGVTALSTSFLALRQVAATTMRSLSAGLSGTVGKFAEFDRVNRQVAAQFGKGAADIKDIADGFTDIGTKTVFTTEEIQRAGLALAQMGAKEADLLPLLRTAADVATVTGTDLVIAAKTAKSMMNQFGLEAKDAAKMSTLLIESATGSAADIADLGLAMRGTGAVASLMGQQVEEVTAIVAQLKDVGTESGTAGKAMRKFYTSLAVGGMKTGNQMDVLTKLRFVPGNDQDALHDMASIDPSKVGAIQIMENLRSAGMDTGDALKFFGNEFGATIAALMKMDGAGDDALAKIKEFKAQFQNSASAGEKLATAQSGIAYEMEQTSGAFDAAQTKIGELITHAAGLEPVMIRVREAVTGVADSLMAIKPDQLKDMTFRVFSADTLTSIFDSAINNILPAMGKVVGAAFGFGVKQLIRFTPLVGVSMGKATLDVLGSGFIAVAEAAGKAMSGVIESALLLTVGGLTEAMASVAGPFANGIRERGAAILGDITKKGKTQQEDIGKGADAMRDMFQKHVVGAIQVDSKAQIANGDDLVKRLGLDDMGDMMGAAGGLKDQFEATVAAQQQRIQDQHKSEFEAARATAASAVEQQRAIAAAQRDSATQQLESLKAQQATLQTQGAGLQAEAATMAELAPMIVEQQTRANRPYGGQTSQEIEANSERSYALREMLKERGVADPKAALGRVSGMGGIPQQQAQTATALAATLARIDATMLRLEQSQKQFTAVDARVQTIYAAATPEDLARAMGEPAATGGGTDSGRAAR